MTYSQEIIFKWLEENPGYSDPEISGSDAVSVTDPEGRSRILTINLYLDILDKQTKEIIAESCGNHSLDQPLESPVKWKAGKGSS